METVNLFAQEALDNYKKYSNRVFLVSAVGANAIQSLDGDRLPKDVWVTLLFEFIFFYVAHAQASARAVGGDEYAERVIKRLGTELVNAAVDYVFDDVQKDGNEALKSRQMQELSARLGVYGKYERAIPEKEGEEAKGTALWTFCRKVAAFAGHPDDVSYTMTCHAHIFDSLAALDTETFVMFSR